MTSAEVDPAQSVGRAATRLGQSKGYRSAKGMEAETVRRRSVEFWYSRRQALLILFALFAMGRIYSEVTPPFQSPDEFNHVKRAYLLSKGVLLATNTEGVVGGEIDVGLMNYMKCFGNIPFNYDNKIDRATIRACNALKFTDLTTFSSFSNTAAYFPLLYSPQALALFIGRIGGLTVSNSYYLARLFSQLASLALLLFSMTVFPLPPAVLMLFLMPMSLFQLASASLDALSFSTVVAISALFMRGYDGRLPFSRGMHLSLSICILLLSLARIIYIAIAPLLLILCHCRRSKRFILDFIIISCIWTVWILYVRSAVLGGHLIEGVGVEHIGGQWAFVSHAWSFCFDLFRTLTTPGILEGYLQSFLGVLGASDTPLGSFAYVIFCGGLLTAIGFSVNVRYRGIINGGSVTLGLVCLVTVLLMFFVAFEDWTAPGRTIDGIQGRYFYPSAILCLYSMWGGYLQKIRAAACVAIMVLMMLSSIELSIPALLDRYWANEGAGIHYLGNL